MSKSINNDVTMNPPTVEPPCATTSPKRQPIQNTKTYPVKALQLELLVNDHLL